MYQKFLVSIFIVAVIYGCKKQDINFSLPPLTDYYPLQTGKVLIYRLDSTSIPPFGTALLIKSYAAKDSIGAAFNDNLNRLSYRVYRYITDTLMTQAWQYQSTYYVTPTDESIEMVDDNNLRFIKLKQPMRNDFSWQGNAYIDTKSGTSLYQYLDGWSYTYQNVNAPDTVLKGVLDSTITVWQQDETSPPGSFDPANYQQRNYSVEVYAKHVGLVFKEFLHWTWQTTPPPAKYEDGSYGIKLNLIDVR